MQHLSDYPCPLANIEGDEIVIRLPIAAIPFAAKIAFEEGHYDVDDDTGETRIRWVVRLRVERGNVDGWEDLDFPFFSRGEAEAFIIPALLANNVILGRRMWLPWGDETSPENGSTPVVSEVST